LAATSHIPIIDSLLEVWLYGQLLPCHQFGFVRVSVTIVKMSFIKSHFGVRFCWIRPEMYLQFCYERWTRL